jgi:peptidoglycan-associated lipoprotein
VETSSPCTPQTVHFAFNESVLSAGAQEALQQVVRCIQSTPDRPVRLEGHCDPRGTEEYNLALGDARAQSVKRYLSRMGIEGRRLRAVSKGELEATGTDEAGWARDRKVAPSLE